MFRKNVASQFIHFQGVDATTGGIKSGVTWTVRRCIDGTFAAGGGTVTEDSTNGWYKYAMSQADTNGNNIGFNFTGTGAVPQTVNIITTACDPTTATNFGITALPATAVTSNASLITSGSGTDQLTVSGGIGSADAKKINAVSTSSVTTVNANIGVTQPINFTGTAGSALVKADTIDVGGTAQTARDLGAGVIVTTNNDKTGYALTQAFPSNFSATAIDSGGNVATQSSFKKNVARANFQFLMTDNVNHAPATGLTISCTRSIDGGAFGAGTLANATEVASGTYRVDFGSGDLNGNVIILKVTATGADTRFERIVTDP